MPKRTDIKTILLIGSGPIIIGQACEFDYSGTQAAKTLKELGYRLVLINSNPATIMSDPEFADATYIEPITKESILAIIKKEKVDAILPTMGGQIALNVAMECYESGLLKGVAFLGANPKAIKKGEDRQLFKECMQKIGVGLPKSMYAYNYEEACKATTQIGFPLMIRASFTMGGAGSGVVYNQDEFKELATKALMLSPINEILIEESLLGWKEYEMEVIRDKNDNCIIVCSIENLDPMGVHTGDSITVAPALTLTDKEYQEMRNASFAILREIGVDTGGSNVQFAINPTTGKMIVIEMNPRVSRSSALASKATGYPIAKVATMLAVGFSLDEIENDITKTPASFEPALDYIVTKIPRFTFEKFKGASTQLGTAMKSVGEVMAIGRTFKESLNKALCSLERGFIGLESVDCNEEELCFYIRTPNENRLFYIATALRRGKSVEEIYELCKINTWFLEQIKELTSFEEKIDMDILNKPKLLRKAKSMGFSDAMLARIINQKDALEISENDIYFVRTKQGINTSYDEVDTCAGEFEAYTPYYYSSFDLNPTFPKNELCHLKGESKVLIIGAGPNRIGQGIEFDYACVHAAYALRDLGIKTIMYNCNPETVSTDYDTSDFLYFEPNTFEHLRALIEKENPDYLIVHFGGQTPLKFAKRLSAFGAKIMGTSARVIDLAEDRKKFSAFIQKLGIKQPKNHSSNNLEDALIKADDIGYPILVRPSYVLGGRAMRIIYNKDELCEYMKEYADGKNLILIDQFLDGASELDVDAISDGSHVYIGAVMEHIEEAGIHSGDSACILPPKNIAPSMIDLIEIKTKEIALNLGVIGLLNIQFAIYKDELFMIEVNPRASRTVPFVSKATGVPLAKVATRVMWQGDLREALSFYDTYSVVVKKGEIYLPKKSPFVAIKAPVFPFAKLEGCELDLGPEMKSTGEVMGISQEFANSFAKAQIASFNTLPQRGTVFLSLKDKDKHFAPILAKEFIDLGFEVVATGGTAKAIEAKDLPCKSIYKISQGRPNIEDKLKNKEIALVINTSDYGGGKSSQDDTRVIRQNIIRFKIPYFTNIRAALASIHGIRAIQNETHQEVKSLQEYLAQISSF